MLRVNGELVDPDLVEETFSRLKTEAEARSQISCCERDGEFLARAEEEVANSILIAQEAEKRYPEIPDEEVKPQLEETIKRYREHGASWEMLEAERDQLRSGCAADLRMEKLVEEVAGKDLAAGEEEIGDFYRENEELYRHAPEARSLHLVKFFSESDDPAVLYREMLAWRGKLCAGADFADLARAKTDKPTGEVDLGWIDFDRPTNPFEALLFSLEKDEVSPVLAYEHAFHLVKIVELKEACLTPLEEVREQISVHVVHGKKRDALQNLALILRESANIETADFSHRES